MKVFLLGLGASVLGALKNLLSSTTAKVVVSVPLVLALLYLIPFEIALPQEIIDVFTSDFFRNLMLSLTFLAPLDFALKCLLISLIARHSSLFARIVQKIFGIFKGGA